MKFSTFLAILLVVICNAIALRMRREGDSIPETPQKEENEGKREMEIPQKYEKRGRKSKRAVLSESTLYGKDAKGYSATVEEMCVFAHNYVRGKHEDTPDVVWDASLAAGCEAYAKKMVTSGKLEHATGDFGENLYVSENSYGAESTPGHAVLSWYSESWDPLPQDGKIKHYDYSFDPQDVASIKAEGTGHFTATVWKSVKKVGCGVATTTFSKDGKPWTRTYIVGRYSPVSNVAKNFPDNVKPLKSGDASLYKKIRVSDCLPGASDCKDSLEPSECEMYKNYNFCSIVASDCNCEC